MSPQNRPGRDLVRSQLALGGLLAVCVLVTPRFVLEPNEGGVSNYGVHAATVVPYTLAFVLCAWLLGRSGRALRRAAPPERGLGMGFEVLAALFLLVLVSTYPYKVDGEFDDLHLASAFALFGAESVLLAWVVFVRSRRAFHAALWLSWLAGLAVTVATLAGLVHLLLLGQAIMSAGFAAVTIAVTAPPRQRSDATRAGRLE